MDVLTWLALDVCTDFRVVESLGRLRERLKFKPCAPSFPYILNLLTLIIWTCILGAVVCSLTQIAKSILVGCDFEKVSTVSTPLLSLSHSLHHISIPLLSKSLSWQGLCHPNWSMDSTDWIFQWIIDPLSLSIDPSSIWPNLPKKQNWELVFVVEGGTQLTSPELGLCWKLITFSSEMTPTLPPSPQFRSDTSFAVRCARFELAKKYRAPKIRPCAGYGWPKYSPIGLEAPLWPQQHPPIQQWT